jgi:hypothetical protein
MAIGTATGMGGRVGSERTMAGTSNGTASTGSDAARANNTGIGTNTATTGMGGMHATASTETHDAILADLTRLEMLVQGVMVKTRLAATKAGLSIAEIMNLAFSGGEDKAATVEFLKMAIEMDGGGKGRDNIATRTSNGNGDVEMTDAGAGHGVNGNGNIPPPPPPLPANWRLDGVGDAADESDSSVDWDEWLHMEKFV